MALPQSLWVTRQRNTAVSGCAGVEVAQMFEFTIPGATAIPQNDIIELGILPANNEISGATLICDDLDTGTTLTLDVGVMSGEVGEQNSARTCGAELFSGATVGQAGGVAHTALASAYTIAATDKDRSIGVKIATAATAHVAGRKLRLLLKYRAV